MINFLPQVMLVLSLAIFFAASNSVYAAGLSHVKTNITGYANARLQDPKMAEWINARVTNLITNTNTLYPFQARQNYYLDVYVLASFDQYTQYVDYLKANGWAYESTMLHARNDYTTANAGITWDKADKFDRFENARGVLQSVDNNTFTDVTTAAYGNALTWGDNMYFGYELPFDRINLTISQAAMASSQIWEYWNGSTWTALTDHFSDGTNGLAVTGARQVYFYPPVDWARRSITVGAAPSRNKYWVRSRLVGATVYPKTTAIKGDTWLNGSAQAARGWNGADASIINRGTELEYNPNAGSGESATASARFPYQARISAWSNNHFIMNPGNIQGGVSPWDKYLANVYIGKYEVGFGGGFMDDLGGKPTTPPVSNTDFVGTWSATFLGHINNVVNYVHAVHPEMLMGGTNYYRSIFPYIDFSLQEYLGYVPHPSDAQGILTSENNSILQYDSYIPPYNPLDQRTGANLPAKFGIMVQADLYDNLSAQYGINYAWDRSNRGPILALAKHYISANENTYFEYQTQNYVYSYIDEVLLKNGSTVYLADGTRPSVADVAVWRKWFPAIEANVGVPDANGYNGGVRDLQWITGSTSGDGRADVWRRDYTNAIILVRTAHYQTSVADMDNYYTPIDLGGDIYYPLRADGTTTAGVTSISLRAGEGAILMKAPIGTDAIAPAIPTGLSVQ